MIIALIAPMVAGHAQGPTTSNPAFDAASIKPNGSAGGRSGGAGGRLSFYAGIGRECSERSDRSADHSGGLTGWVRTTSYLEVQHGWIPRGSI